MPHPWWLVVILVLSIPHSTSAQKCAADGTLSFYDLSPRPTRNDPVIGGDTIGSCPDNGLCVSGLLRDSELGPVESPYTSNVVHAWSSAEKVVITYTYASSGTYNFRHINLFFYHIPTLGIGLPNIEIFVIEGSTATSLPYYITDNEDLTPEDSGRRDVTLSFLDGGQTSRAYRIEFDFESTNVQWLVLSEIIMCQLPATAYRPMVSPSLVASPSSISLGADDFTTDFNLTCTVSGEGKFSWQWNDPNGGSPSTMVISDATRTSTALFTDTSISSNDAGMVSFTCEATYDPEVTGIDGIQQSGLQEITVELANELMPVTDASVTAELLDNVTMACEIYGYFPPELPEIVWRFVAAGEDSIDLSDQATLLEGSRFIQNGESPIPSVISELTIFNISNSDEGTYTCHSFQEVEVFTLTIISDMPPPPPADSSTIASISSATTVSPSTPPPPPPPSLQLGSTTVIIIAVAGALVLVILLTIIIIVVLVVLRNRNAAKRFNLVTTNRKDSLDYTGEPFYQEMPKPPTPPLPVHFPSLNSNPEIEAYAVVNNTNGGFEMKGIINQPPTFSPPPPMTHQEVAPIHTGSDQVPGFLEKNPLYASSDNMASDKNQWHRGRQGSIPSLDVLTDSPYGSQLNIYAEPCHLTAKDNSSHNISPPPPVPNRLPTPELLDDPIYSEAHIQPTTFRERMPSPPSEDESLPCFSVYANPQPLLRSEGPKEVTVNNINELNSLGVGQFGQVLLADTIGLSLRDLGLSSSDDRKDISIQVAVKRLKTSAEPHIKEAFEKEIKFMSRLRSENVVRLLGICQTGDLFIIMEYMVNGDLNQFLHKHKLVPVEATPTKRGLTPKQLTYICSQIANGMKYLAAFKFIHRDLATRNCLVGTNLKIKIADFGMSRSLYSSDYYRISGRAMLPIRWMANECFYGKFSEKTDVWAFGVTMWEVFTFSREQPYEGKSDQEVIDDAIKGPNRELPVQPDGCPNEVYEVMRHCWVHNPEKRARFKHAREELERIYEFGKF